MNCGLKEAPFIIQACCVLHNFIQHHSDETADSSPLTQRDNIPEPDDLRAAGRVRIRLHAGRRRLLTLAHAASPPLANPAGDLPAGKAVREELKEYCWQLHLHRREDRQRVFEEAHAAAIREAEDDEGYDHDPDDAWE
jgi:hypothetical protein